MSETARKPQLFNQLVNSDAMQLTDLFKKIQQLESLQKLWQIYVPDNLRAYTKVANYRDDCLVIAVVSAAWATELRFILPQMLELLRKEGKLYQLRSISFYVDPEFKLIINE